MQSCVSRNSQVTPSSERCLCSPLVFRGCMTSHRSEAFKFCCFWGERVNVLYDGTKKKRVAPNTSIFGLRHVSYSKQFLPGITGMLDVLTPLSDCRQESVEKMERRISAVSYMYWMDFYNGISCRGFVCAWLISLSLFVSLFVSPFCVSLFFRLPRLTLVSLFPATTLRATTPHLYTTGYHAQGYHALPPLHGYHTCVYIYTYTPAITP